MDACLKALLTQTINVRPVTAFSPGGQETLGAAVPIPAYVELKRGTAPAPGGTEVAVTHMIITEVAVGLDQRVWLPGDSPADLKLGKRPMNVMAYKDEAGNPDHFEVTL